MKRNGVKHNDIDNGLRIYACDFETTTAAISTDKTAVWSFCVDEIGAFQPEIFGSIDDFFEFIGDPRRGVHKRLYFHNLKFDGEFILYEALNNRGMQTALGADGNMIRERQMIEGDITYAISDVGQWYFIHMVYNNCFIDIRDSLKILPMDLKTVGKSFCHKYQKSEMDYDSKTSLADCSASDIEYIKNDVLVLSEALDYILGLHGEQTPFGPINSLTIGGFCLQKFKEMNYGESKNILLKLDKKELDYKLTGSNNMDEYIRKAYRGGFCYVNKDVAGKIQSGGGYVMDVNSLYPFVMCTEYSGFVYPYGAGKYAEGEVLEKYVQDDSYYFYARIMVSFELKPGYIPTIQKKGTFMFAANEYLQSSRVFDSKTREYVGEPRIIELTLSKDDYIMFREHYHILTYIALDYIVFMTAPGLCDSYIKEMEKIKIAATESGNSGERTCSKLASNNLYGQFSKSINSSFKLAAIEESGALRYDIIPAYDKKPVNIAIGAAVTAHARTYQIGTIQRNLDRFCYSDTDSLHCTGDPADFIGDVHETRYGAYKCEGVWTRAKFVRQKTYIEENSTGELNICCAGMTAKQKEIFKQLYRFEDFEKGLTIHGGKLMPKRVPGGVILVETDFTIV